ncbi:MAG: DUF4416 family protein [Candidatus Atribacteria bacterium]|nr:DUF4416 family protein [Candidatus Atribacteria bacterium]
MGNIVFPKPVKLICSIISSQENIFSEALICLMKAFGRVDFESNYQAFDYTDYYQAEMGTNLKQKIVSFEKLISPDHLTQIKKETNQLEFELSNDPKSVFSKEIKRKVNFDPGYLTLSKFVIASTKNGPARIYLDGGIFAEIMLSYTNRSFRPLEWTYRNYQTELFLDFFNQVRKVYKDQIRQNNEK